MVAFERVDGGQEPLMANPDFYLSLSITLHKLSKKTPACISRGLRKASIKFASMAAVEWMKAEKKPCKGGCKCKSAQLT